MSNRVCLVVVRAARASRRWLGPAFPAFRRADGIQVRHALDVDPQLSGIAPARRWAAGKLTEAGISGHVFDVLILLISEVVTNAVAHASPPVSLHLEIAGERVRVEVYDCAREVPIVRHPDPSALGGRGVNLVDQLATCWGTETFENSEVIKLVWFELDLSEQHA